METTISKTGSNQLSMIQDNFVNPEVINRAKGKTDFSINSLTIIVKNKNRRVCLLPPGDQTNLYLLGQIVKIAQAYGASKNISETVQAECVRILKTKFQRLSIPEVWEAYRSYSAGLLDNDKGRGEMYGGNFTAKSFGAVLKAWSDYRKAAVAIYEKELQNLEDEREEEKRQSKMKEKFLPDLKRLIEKLKAEESDWRAVPSFIYEALKKRGLIVFEDKSEWKDIWDDALSLVESELISEVKDRRGREVMSFKDLNFDFSESQKEEKAKQIARKLAVYRKVILNQDFEFPS